MKMLHKTFAIVAGLALMGCPTDDAPPVDDTGTGDSGTTNGPTTNPMTMTTADGTETDAMTSTGTDSSGSESTTGPGGAQLPEFPKLDPAAYTQIDRMGFPAVNTGLILPRNKDAYNADTPVSDASLTYVNDILTSLEVLHVGIPGMQTPDNTGLDDDLMALGLTPCDGVAPADTCDDQGAPFVIPDVIEIVVGGGDAFPNGRRPAEPVMDIILAVLLIEIQADTDLLTFLDLNGDGTIGDSLNPFENDVPFPGEFPYLAPPHE